MGGGFQPALPMRGVTFAWSSVWPSTAKFQPALPMRGVTFGGASYTFGRVISTRTPHAGSDRGAFVKIDDLFDFNPHSPCGE